MQEPEKTLDTISDHIALWQHKRGYRFGLDALLLATNLENLKPEQTLVDLGAGQGPVALAVSARRHDVNVIAIERQDTLFALLQENIAHNQEHLGSIQAHHIDLRTYRDHFQSHSVDWVLSNPPYFPPDSRRPSTQPERAHARHELAGTLQDFINAACYLLKPRGWFKMVLPPWRLQDVFAALANKDTGIAHLRFVHDRPEDPAYLVEIMMRRSSKPTMEVLPALCVRNTQGFYSEEVAQRLAHAAHPSPQESLIERFRNTRA